MIITQGQEESLTVKAEYTVPTPLLGKLAKAFITKTNEREADQGVSRGKF